MTDTTTTQTPAPQTSDVVMQFLTQGGATIELHQQTRTVNWQYGQPGFLIGNGETRVSNGFNWRCLGCGSIGGGGRYNGLVAQIGGPEQPGVGFGLGLERVLLVLEKQGVALPAEAVPDLYFIALGEAAESRIVTLLNEARARGLIAEKDYGGRKMKAQLKSADRIGARYAAILGDDELGRGEIVLKELATGEQKSVPLAELWDAAAGTFS